MKKNFPFFLVKISPWPIIMSLNLMNLFISIVLWINFKFLLLMIIMFMNLIMIKILWFRDIIRESTFMGYHTFYIKIMLKFSMIMFIISELFFFISFFWTFFHSSISPSIEINMIWPPKMIKVFNYMEIPLLNTFTLITSGFYITLSHLYFLNNFFYKSMKALLSTILMGLYFSMIQMFEYMNSYFCINDSIYGSIFFLSTGFHGIHVLVGTIMLIVSFIRMYKFHFSLIHHINFELSIWYWHFVDVIWLFLYLFYYMLI
ncbi:cytochrome c oxidase subunit 3 (mitochondrion) [Frieseomelitta varia]|uniref:Cytochrome c oxidase subunit 3 n=1 Tax=Frieseomelitta varia TaxID=561572 RepID=A0A833R3S9_9HYME|nr:cytochrome c oxidase subunit 3 [Frieseomelitta varia]